VDKDHLLKALMMITGAVKAMGTLNDEALASTMMPMVSGIWEKLMAVL
jgi:hypothetical protein